MALISKFTLPVLMSGALLAPVGQAFANNFDFYTPGSGYLVDHVSTAPNYNSGNLGVTVRAYGSSGAVASVAERWDGLGVSTGLTDPSGIDNDGNKALGEYLVLTFSKAVTLNSLDFSYWSNDILGLGGDRATLSWGSNSISLANLAANGVLNTVSFSGLNAPTGTVFTLRANASPGLFGNGATDFRLAGINAVAAVPEPGTYALMGLGLAGLALVARRRSQG